MEIVKFLDKTWREIPQQDNPAIPYEGQTQCIMIFKGDKEDFRITGGGVIVAKVEPGEDIQQLGVFWTPESADLFAAAVSLTS